MPHVTFVFPCIGRFPDTRYIKSWQMQPLSIAVLAALTPQHWRRTFFDDRLEPIPYGQATDLVAISIETYTAKRGYQIAEEYRRRGVPVVMGGYHATFCQDEVLEYADAVCIGEAEGIWGKILEDCERKRLNGKYRAAAGDLCSMRVDRTIFHGKRYLDIALVETSRGCEFRCKFCSITAFHHATHRRRPFEDILAEIQSQNKKTFFFVDDNIACDPKRAKLFFAALIKMNIQWIGQAGIGVADDPELMELMAESGCLGLLIGFESLNSDNLACMGKHLNQVAKFQTALNQLRRHRILIYGTFVFGFPFDSPELVDQTVKFAREQKLFLAAFNHLVPFPGTPLYEQCSEEGSLQVRQWWLDNEFRFGQVPFVPQPMTAQDLEHVCHKARKKFYSIPSMVQRILDRSANAATVERAKLFLGLNVLLRREVSQKRGLPLGLITTEQK